MHARTRADVRSFCLTRVADLHVLFLPATNLEPLSRAPQATIFVPFAPLVAGVAYPMRSEGQRELLMHSVPALERNQSLLERIIDAYPSSEYGSVTEATNALLRDYAFVCEARRALRALVAGGVRAWQYKFDYKLRWPESQELGLGTYHTSELPFVFRHAWPQVRSCRRASAGVPRFYLRLRGCVCADTGDAHVRGCDSRPSAAGLKGLRRFDAEEWAIADLFNTFWGNFAGTADPNVGAQTPPLRWELYSGTASYLRINQSPSMQQGLAKDVCDILDEVPLEL